MNVHHEMYLKLVVATSDAIYSLQETTKKLILAQQAAEEIFLCHRDKRDQQELHAADLELQAALEKLLRPDDPAEQCDS